MLVTYNMPVLGSSSQVLVDAVHASQLEAVDESYSGCEGQVYAIVDPDDLEWHDEFALRIAGRHCQVNLYALPTAEYLALLQAGKGSKAFDITPLLEVLNANPQNTDLISTRLLEVVRRDKVPVHGFSSTFVTPYSSIWLASSTRFCQTSHGWYVVLRFETRGDCHPVTAGKAAYGLDVGVFPVVTSVNTRGDHCQIDPPPILPVNQALQQAHGSRETHLIRRIAHEVQYAVVRQRLETLMTDLIEHATVVVVEELDFAGLKRFEQRADLQMRDLGIIDFIHAWLPQRLAEFGIRLYRYPAAYTSQVCSRCYSRGTRVPGNRDVFQCSKCGQVENAHMNAASILAQVGLSAVLEEMQEQLRRPTAPEAADD